MSMPEEEAVFNAARRISSAEARKSYLADACGTDTALRARIEALLRVYESNQTFLQTPAVVLSTGAESIAGTLIGPYKLIEQIGEGGMGVVYAAEQSEPLQRQVALKIIKPGMDSRHVIARFEAERQALALMSHPNIAKVFDAGATANGRPYFAMELIEGVTITRYCDEHHLTPRERLELFVPVCRAVQHAHQKGVIHRDLKPSNVLVSLQDGKPLPKVIDFGVAKAVGNNFTEQTNVTGFGNVVGTFAYMSPEQAEPNQHDIDSRSDIYSLGVMMYELLTGTTPFGRERFRDAAWSEMLRVLREEEPPKPSTRLSHVEELPTIAANRGLEPKKLSVLMRGDLDWIVMKSLEKDRSRRYHTANGLARDIERYLQEEPVEAGPPGAAYRIRKFARRHKTALASGVSFLLLLIAGVVVSTWLAVMAIHAKRQAGIERDNAIAEKDRADQQAAIATAVNEFLRVNLLEQADITNQPAGTERNRNITVRELLDRAAKNIDLKFSNQPRTEAAIRQTVGNAYRALAEYPEAEKQLQRAVELYNLGCSPRHPESLECTKYLADAYFAHGNFADAERLYRQVLDVRRADLGDNNLETLRSMNNLGLLLVAQGRYAEADGLLQLAVQGLTEQLGKDDLTTLESMNGLAVLNYSLRRYERAGRLFLQLRDGFRSKLGADHPYTLASAGNLGAVYMSAKKYGEAEAILDEVLVVKRRTLGPDHPETLSTMQNLALVYQELKRFDEAEAIYQKVIEGRRIKQGPDHLDTLRAMQNFATYFVDRGQYEQAESLYRDVLSVQRVKLGDEHPETIVVLNNLGMLDRRRGEYHKAEKHFQQALAAARKTLTLKHSDTQEIVGNLAMVHYLHGTPELSEAMLRETLDLLESQPEKDYPATAFALSNLSLNLLAQKKFSEAEAFARRCLDLRTKLAPNRWSTFMAKSLLGGALAGQQKFAEAEPLLVQGYQGMKQRESAIPYVSLVHVDHALQRLIQLYENWGKPDEAEKWRKLATPPRP